MDCERPTRASGGGRPTRAGWLFALCSAVTAGIGGGGAASALGGGALWGLAGCDGDLPLPPSPTTLLASGPDGSAPVRPTDTLWLRLSRPADAASVNEGSVLLLSGLLDDDLRRRLERGALTDADRGRLVPLRLALAEGGQRIEARPRRPLAAEATHTLFVSSRVTAAGRRLPAPLERALRTGSAASAEPWPTLVSPPDRAEGVVRNLRSVAVRFSRPVGGVDAASLRLLDDGGEAVVGAWARLDGDGGPAGGGGPGLEYRLDLGAPLRPLRRYHLEAGTGITDDQGEVPFALDPPPAFTAGAAVRSDPPRFTALALAASSGCLMARIESDPPADARLCAGAACVADAALASQHELAWPLPPGGALTVEIEARDESTAPPARSGPLPAPATSPRPLILTEVLSRPRGSHYAQQFVEVENRGTDEAGLDGLWLEVDGQASALPAARLPPGARGLIVPVGFVRDDGLDPVPVEGTVLAPLATGRLGGRGVLVDGSQLLLREADGRPVSRFSTLGLKLDPGQSARREGPCDREGAFQPTPGGGATPGGP